MLKLRSLLKETKRLDLFSNTLLGVPPIVLDFVKSYSLINYTNHLMQCYLLLVMIVVLLPHFQNSIKRGWNLA